MIAPEVLEAIAGEDLELAEAVQAGTVECLLGDGDLDIDGEPRLVSEVLLGPRGPAFQAAEREIIEELGRRSVRLYQVREVGPRGGVSLLDLLAPDAEPVWIDRSPGSTSVRPLDLFGLRLVNLGGGIEITPAFLPFPYQSTLEILDAIAEDVAAIPEDAPEGSEAMFISLAIRDLWFDTVFPQLTPFMDDVAFEPDEWVTDRYEVADWTSVAHSLGRARDVVTDKESGWVRVSGEENEPGRPLLWVFRCPDTGHLCAEYRSLDLAAEGRPWLEGLVGDQLEFVGREVEESHGGPEADTVQPLGPEIEDEPAGEPDGSEREQRRELYEEWTRIPNCALDHETPKDAVGTADGRRRVIQMIELLERDEQVLADELGEEPISFDPLWEALSVERPGW